MRMRAPILLCVAAVTASSLAAGCTSRTLPLPPPAVEAVSAADSAGIVTIRGLASEGASIGVINDQSMQGVIHSSGESGCGGSCPFSLEVEAGQGDHLRLWQFFEAENSLDVQVPGE